MSRIWSCVMVTIFCLIVLISIMVLLLADQGRAQAADVTQRKDPLAALYCQLTIDGLEGNRPELRPGAMFFQAYSVETVRPSGTASAPVMFVLTVKLSIPQVSPLFMLANATGVHFGQAAMQCMTQTNAIVLQWTLWDVAISSYKSRLDAVPGLPMDEVSLSASKVEFNNVAPPIKFSWDTKANQGGVVTPTGAVQYLPPPLPARPPLPGVQNVPPPVPLR
jgi:type VI protein secretion system component Hcp